MKINSDVPQELLFKKIFVGPKNRLIETLEVLYCKYSWAIF